MTASSVPIFDGHNDALLRLFKAGDLTGKSFFERGSDGHVDLPRCRDGHMVAGFFAIFVPSPVQTAERRRANGQLLSAAEALDPALAMASLLHEIEQRSNGQAQIVRDFGDLERCRASGRLAMIMHMEGAEALGPELEQLDRFVALGLRSIGPLWSRDNEFGFGAPFTFPGSPDTGPGLTEAGKNLVRTCNRRGLMLDLSHLNEKGFWDVVRIATAPLVATHSNSHAITPAPRNLTDPQLDAIAASGGVVGLNYATCFLREDGKMDADTPLDALLRHLDRLLDRLGERGVALGSDFDGDAGARSRRASDRAYLPPELARSAAPHLACHRGRGSRAGANNRLTSAGSVLADNLILLGLIHDATTTRAPTALSCQPA